MKKTLVALLALSSVAMAATKEDINTSDPNLVSYWNFATNSQPTKNENITWKDTPTWNAGGFGIMNTGSNHLYTENAGLSSGTGFTISFDVKDITQVGSILTMTVGNMDQDWRSMSIDVGDKDQNVYPVKAWFHGDPTHALTSTQALTDWTTITLVTTSGDNNTIILDYYVDGEHFGQSATSGANLVANKTFNKVQIGYFGNSAKGANFSVDNILVYNKALTANEVKGLIANNVPEPATGALSLLALAGLCIRRRK